MYQACKIGLPNPDRVEVHLSQKHLSIKLQERKALNDSILQLDLSKPCEIEAKVRGAVPKAFSCLEAPFKAFACAEPGCQHLCAGRKLARVHANSHGHKGTKGQTLQGVWREIWAQELFPKGSQAGGAVVFEVRKDDESGGIPPESRRVGESSFKGFIKKIDKARE